MSDASGRWMHTRDLRRSSLPPRDGRLDGIAPALMLGGKPVVGAREHADIFGFRPPFRARMAMVELEPSTRLAAPALRVDPAALQAVTLERGAACSIAHALRRGLPERSRPGRSTEALPHRLLEQEVPTVLSRPNAKRRMRDRRRAVMYPRSADTSPQFRLVPRCAARCCSPRARPSAKIDGVRASLSITASRCAPSTSSRSRCPSLGQCRRSSPPTHRRCSCWGLPPS
jgi:hypothetical protein